MNEDLVKRFAPILFLHPEEKFVPVDAKRFVESANLWSASAPLGDKTRWGDPGSAPLLRQPTVSAGDLSGVSGEGGKLIDGPGLQPAADGEMFLELGGWKKSDEAHEPGVTSSSGNAYADRGAIASLYAQGSLQDSRFWYHAELYDGVRLTSLARQAGPPDFSPFLKPNSALLCYYMFFPAHQQSVSTGQAFCNNSVGSHEAACHAGDWQCMAILLEGDGTGNAARYTPKFFGCTGARPTPNDGTSQFRPCQFDADGLTVMKVERWQPDSGPATGLPKVDGDHPRLFVALGSHGLYTTPGNREVLPFRDGEESQWCATFDTPSVMPQGWGQDDDDDGGGWDFGAFLGKFLTGLGNGGAVGAAAGVLVASAEGTLGSGLDVVGTYDGPDPDKVAAAGAGMTIKPKGVTVSGVGSTVEDWRVTQNLQIDDRRYDYLVDRDEQRWWPNDDLETGFRGRWGQRVTADFLPRRSGPKFPDYLKMFLLALAAGDANSAFDDQ